MASILLGVLAALLWGFAPLTLARAARQVGPAMAAAWVALLGCAIASVAGLAAGGLGELRDGLGWQALALLAVTGIGLICGMRGVAAAFAQGDVSIVAPISSSQGALAAAIAVALGEALAPLVAFGLAIVASGVILVTLPGPRGATGTRSGASLRVVALAVFACVGFSLTLVAGGPAGDRVGPFAVAAVVRLLAFAVLGLPLLLAGRLRIDRRGFVLVALTAVFDVGGYLAFLIAADIGSGVAVPSVLVSQSAVVAVLLGVAFLGERLRPLQAIGVAGVLVGVLLVAIGNA